MNDGYVHVNNNDEIILDWESKDMMGKDRAKLIFADAQKVRELVSE